jgi:hypothetical protein
MKLINFSFKAEPVWMLVFSFAPAVIVVLVVMLLLLIRWLRLM